VAVAPLSVAPEPPVRSQRAQRAVTAVALAVGALLRVWSATTTPASFDEAFTGSYAHLPLTEIPAAVRADDSHPPLDYVLRHAAGELGDVVALRAPSVAFGIATLVFVAWWVRARGWLGVAVVVATSLSTFQIAQAGNARPYALLVLCGTVAAWASERWLVEPTARGHRVAAAALLVALLDHATGMLLAGGLALLPGLRRDPAAWRWRRAVGVAVAAWGLSWGPAFVDQLQGDHATWIPFTTVEGAAQAIGALVTLDRAMLPVVIAALAAGTVRLARRDRPLGRTVLCLGVVPFAAACAIGLRNHFLLTRSLAPMAWAVPCALAAALGWVAQAGRAAVVAAALAIGLVSVMAVGPALQLDYPETDGRRVLADRARPGDVVVLAPSWLWPLVRWDMGAPIGGDPMPSAISRLRDGDVFTFTVDGAAATGVVWLAYPDRYPLELPESVSCGDFTPPANDLRIECRRVAPSSLDLGDAEVDSGLPWSSGPA
jgi:hypothetical protein